MTTASYILRDRLCKELERYHTSHDVKGKESQRLLVNREDCVEVWPNVSSTQTEHRSFY